MQRVFSLAIEGCNAFVLLSLFVLVANTHPAFKRPLTSDDWVDYFTDEEEKKYLFGLVGYDIVQKHSGNLSENGTFEEVFLPSDIYVTANFMFYLTCLTVYIIIRNPEMFFTNRKSLKTRMICSE
jgi:hypothetical protein